MSDSRGAWRAPAMAWFAWFAVAGCGDNLTVADAGVDDGPVADAPEEGGAGSVRVTPSTGLITSEAGAVAQFEVVLAVAPTATVTIPLATTSAEGAVAPAQLVFTPASWSTAQRVTVTGQNDFLDDGDQPYGVVLGPIASTDARYAGLAPATVTLTNTDDDARGITVTPGSSLQTSEDLTGATFTIVLTAQPTADVTIAFTVGDASEGTVSPAAVTFTSASWNAPRSVTVTGLEDALTDGDVTYAVRTEPATSADPGYDGFDGPDVTVTNADNEGASAGGVTITPLELVVTELGAADADSFDVVLDRMPLAPVTLGFTVGDPTEATISTASVTFTALDWNLPQTVTVTGLDDADVDGNVAFAILTHPVTSADPAFAGLDPPDVNVLNVDDETANVVVRVRRKIFTTETGQSAFFRMRLTTSPAATVTCAVQSADLTEGTVAPATVVFGPGDFGNRTLAVTGIDDTAVDGDVTYVIATEACTSADPAYDGFDPRDFSVINRDNE